MTRQEFIDDLYRLMVLKGMEYEIAYREACDAADVREEHQAFEQADPNKIPDEYWDNAPDWAEWAAMDENGYWCWFRTEPEIRDYNWSNYIDYDSFTAAPVSDWTKSLTKRPDNG